MLNSTSESASRVEHITVCVCTYKRPLLLKRLLTALGEQETKGQFTFSVVVADNDHCQSAKATVCGTAQALSIVYCAEPRQGISLARNKAVENAMGDFVAFIDDDEFPASDWLLQLFTACNGFHADGALGPVRRHFDEAPPRWILKGKFFQRSTHPTGLKIDWTMGRTNNALVKRDILPLNEPVFRPQFRTGEDQDFFRRMIENGKRFVWCEEAVVYEVVPPVRWSRVFLMKRALLQGTDSQLHPRAGMLDTAKTLVAIPAYACVLPFALLFGQHRFVSVSVKLAYHLGRLLGLLHLNPIRKPYVFD